MVKPPCSNFKVITANVSDVRTFRCFTVVCTYLFILCIKIDKIEVASLQHGRLLPYCKQKGQNAQTQSEPRFDKTHLTKSELFLTQSLVEIHKSTQMIEKLSYFLANLGFRQY